MKTTYLIYIIISLFISSCASSHIDSYKAQEQQEALEKLSRQAFIKNTLSKTGRDIPELAFIKQSDFNTAKISPTGEYLAVTFEKGDHSILSFLDMQTKKMIQMINYQTNEHIREVHWVSNSKVIVSVASYSGYLNSETYKPSRLYVVSIDGKNQKELYPAEQLRQGYFQVTSKLSNDPANILIYIDESVQGGKLFKLNIHTGRKSLVVNPPHSYVKSYYASHEGVVHSVVSSESKFGDYFLYLRKDNEWVKTKVYTTYDEKLTVKYISPDGVDVYFNTSSPFGNFLSLYHFNSKTNKIKQVSPNLPHDITGYTYNIFNKRPYEIVYHDEMRRYVPFPLKALRMDLLVKSLRMSFPDEYVTILSTTKDFSKVTFVVTSSKNPGEFYLYNTKTNKASYLFSSRPWINKKNMSQKIPVTLLSRDGKKLRGYMSKPAINKTGKKLPFVLYVHGGPHGVRDYDNYDSEVQLMTSRGYGVLQINYRGSGGYGNSFLTSGYRNWGTTMQDDLTDSVNWLVQQGHAHPKKVCIFGHSYGGYAALMSPTRVPDLYACSIASVAVSDLQAMTTKHNDGSQFESVQKYYDLVFKRDDENWFKKHSPARQAHKIKTPILLVHGYNDVRVPYFNFEIMKAALDKNKKSYEWMVRDEGHGFQKEVNKLDFSVKLIEFLDKNTK
jgi:dipeptidyl aminopeptidase/acylaminoacyl peptidase